MCVQKVLCCLEYARSTTGVQPIERSRHQRKAGILGKERAVLFNESPI